MAERGRVIPAALLAVLVLALAAAPARAEEPGWCVQCHALSGPEGQGLVLGQMAWRGPLAQEELAGCPGLRRARQDLLAAESRLAALTALLPGLRSDRLLTAGLERGLERAVELKRQAQAQPVHSLEEVGGRLAREQTWLAEQVERPLRAQQGLRAEGVLAGLALMAGLALLMAWLRGLRRLARGQAPPPGWADAGDEQAPAPEAALGGCASNPLELVRRGRLP